jgi:hypothetical protein
MKKVPFDAKEALFQLELYGGCETCKNRKDGKCIYGGCDGRDIGNYKKDLWEWKGDGTE